MLVAVEDDTASCALRLSGVVKTFGPVLAIDGLDLEIPRGITFGLLGPNGAGKSTVMRLLVGTATATQGSIEALGMPLPASSRAVRARTGLVPQLDNLDEELTCTENLEVYARLYGVPRRQRREAVAWGLELAQLTERADAFTAQLSGGMRRRLLIARGLLHRPELVLLDEPTVGLDPQVRQSLWTQIEQIRSSGATVVLTTHYIEEAERLCDRVAILDHGRLIALDSPRGLRSSYVRSEIVVEVPGDPDRQRRVAAAAEAAGLAHRPAGTAIAVFTDDVSSLVGIDGLREEDLDHRLRRPANLEDVFVALTGATL